ncbi:MAG: radical SAM protein [Clostridia bacterium]|nr:radical SAM protein [Clostridia bacterium]
MTAEGCMLCPRRCGADRITHMGACNAPILPYIAKASLHMWEEPFISGERGSGAIFFCGCNLKCVFCQNYDISNGSVGKMYDADGIAELMSRLQARGAHNINLVSPAPYVPVIAEAITKARSKGLTLPIVYNTNAYETVEALKQLEGLVDIYLPDLKYVDSGISKKYSGAADYFEYASLAVKEMYRQRGLLELDENGMAKKGVVIRHLVLPGSVDETRRVLDHIAAHFPKEINISLMSQYVPFYRAEQYPPLNRPLLKREYKRAIEYGFSLGLENILTQEMSSATAAYTPIFDGICD